jgi:hypothetical protein
MEVASVIRKVVHGDYTMKVSETKIDDLRDILDINMACNNHAFPNQYLTRLNQKWHHTPY